MTGGGRNVLPRLGTVAYRVASGMGLEERMLSLDRFLGLLPSMGTRDTYTSLPDTDHDDIFLNTHKGLSHLRPSKCALQP